MKQIQQNLLGLWQRFIFEMTFALKSDPWQYRSPYQQMKYQQTLKLLPSIPIKQALELGCAEGYLTAALAARVSYLFAADISQIALKRATQHCAVPKTRTGHYSHVILMRCRGIIPISIPAMRWGNPSTKLRNHHRGIAPTPTL